MAGRTGDRLGHWTSPNAEQQFTSLNNALRIEAATALREQGWSTPLHESDVETRYGPTHIFHYQGTGVPMVLLHRRGHDVTDVVPASVWSGRAIHLRD